MKFRFSYKLKKSLDDYRKLAVNPFAANISSVVLSFL